MENDDPTIRWSARSTGFDRTAWSRITGICKIRTGYLLLGSRTQKNLLHKDSTSSDLGSKIVNKNTSTLEAATSCDGEQDDDVWDGLIVLVCELPLQAAE
jgi:hypothetical protein